MSLRTEEHRNAAVWAGLSYVTDGLAGIRRQRVGRGWIYFAPDGSKIEDPQERKRIAALVIPPAWSDVWICPDPNGHIQATARDARGRKQYRYHRLYREARDQSKFRRVLDFSEILPDIRDRLERDMRSALLSRKQVLATVVCLLDKTLIRVGNDEYARENRSFGLTTLRRRHVEVNGSRLRFSFRGKSGVQHDVAITDRRLARLVQQCLDLPGHELFQYLDGNGRRQSVSSDDVNEYLRQISGRDISAKDFRTWAGTMLAARELWTLGPALSERQAKRNINRAIDTVSERLGNTRAVCRKYYIHPLLLEAYLKGRTGVLNGNGHDPGGNGNGNGGGDGANGGNGLGNGEAPRQRGKAALRREEIAVLQFLQEQ